MVGVFRFNKSKLKLKKCSAVPWNENFSYFTCLLNSYSSKVLVPLSTMIVRQVVKKNNKQLQVSKLLGISWNNAERMFLYVTFSTKNPLQGLIKIANFHLKSFSVNMHRLNGIFVAMQPGCRCSVTFGWWGESEVLSKPARLQASETMSCWKNFHRTHCWLVPKKKNWIKLFGDWRPPGSHCSWCLVAFVLITSYNFCSRVTLKCLRWMGAY